MKNNVLVLKKSLGQVFLQDKNIAKKIVDLLDSKLDNVIEIGPGLGALTVFLVNKHFENFTLVEKDRRFVKELNTTYPNVQIINQDFFDLDIEEVTPVPTYIGNLPYNVASQIILKIIKSKNWKKCVFMCQLEFVDAIASKGKKKHFTVLTDLYCKKEKAFKVKRTAFTNPPKVDSAIVILIPIKNEYQNNTEFEKFLKNCFLFKRKTLINNLKTNYKLNWGSIFKHLQINASVRAEDLELDVFIKIFEAARQFFA